ncbi:MAG TPA: GNAT family N-acetyltransferase [Symbiobacteriaceae bacterium]|nr:GNAT family N-acetyltransferase [Symbiobacteriaceae bacterium]
MEFAIRTFSSGDYQALATLASLYAGTTVTADALRWEDTTRDAKLRCQRWVAEVNGEVVGAGEHMQYAGIYHPRKFDVGVLVNPAFRGRGIGSALLETVMSALAPLDPLTLTASARETCAEGIRFLTKRGYAERMRNWESHLDLTAFNPGAFAHLLERAAEQGYRLLSYADLSYVPERDRKIYQLAQETRRDIPAPEPLTDIAFEEWVQLVLRRPYFWPEGYFIALKGDEFVGLSTLWSTDDEGLLTTGATAVRRSHRGRGVARALKVRALAHAKAAGYKRVKTWNESNNQRMLAINDQLGFVRQPAWVVFQRKLAEER